MAGTFRGGVHPDDAKSLSSASPVTDMPVPSTVVLPVRQHIGAPAKVIVEKGQEVKKGEIVAEAGGFVSVPVHASISGTVKAVEPRFTPLGVKALSVIIEGDGEDAWADGLNSERDISSMTPDDIRKAIGARRSDIRAQFLMEAVTLTLVGGAIGILLGVLIALLVRSMLPTVPAALSYVWVGLGVAISVGVGLFFGYYPANRAASLDPIVCLRYE